MRKAPEQMEEFEYGMDYKNDYCVEERMWDMISYLRLFAWAELCWMLLHSYQCPLCLYRSLQEPLKAHFLPWTIHLVEHTSLTQP